ncbi:hypothetical protein [Roseomonas rosulenta]|uniref:hypothetical protein n=1 Tax=Roseomonas rosulenta TaxID=2748667 RepID=UPI0018DFD4A3|nr:hypothetical protein [Roseomonas rosulenta]
MLSEDAAGEVLRHGRGAAARAWVIVRGVQRPACPPAMMAAPSPHHDHKSRLVVVPRNLTRKAFVQSRAACVAEAQKKATIAAC